MTLSKNEQQQALAKFDDLSEWADIQGAMGCSRIDEINIDVVKAHGISENKDINDLLFNHPVISDQIWTECDHFAQIAQKTLQTEFEKSQIIDQNQLSNFMDQIRLKFYDFYEKTLNDLDWDLIKTFV